MYLNGEYAGLVRDKACELVRGVLDFYRGDHTFKDVCKGYSAGPKSGTTCSFLPHWMMLKIGVSSENKGVGVNGNRHPLVNRDDGIGTKMVYGDGISLLVHNSAFVPAGPNVFPNPGDIVVIESVPNKQADEHTFVFLSKISDTEWETGESGQAASTAANGALEGALKRRAMKTVNGKLWACANQGKPDREVTGWVNISVLDYTPGLLPFTVD